MEIEYLEEFLVIAEEGRLGEAAERLYTTSSSLSKHIHALEKEYGVPLFDRSKRTITLNEYGEILLPYAKKIAALQEEASRKLFLKAASDEKSIAISAGYRIFELAVEFRQKYHIGLTINESYEGKELLKKGECELAFIVDEENKEQDLVKIPFKKDFLIMICNRSHPLASRKQVALSELRGEDFVMFPDSDKNRISKIIRNTCLEAGFEPKVVFTGTVGSNIVDSVAKNMGIALLWKKALEFIMREEIAVVEITPSREIDISLCYMKGRKLSEEAKLFIEFVRSRAEV